MVGEALRRPQFPWCTIFLVAGVLTCQICVLIGNFKTADVMYELGKSTGGWSRVGLGVGKSLQLELDALMNNVSLMLLDGVKQVEFVQDTLDGVLSLVGNTTDEAIANSTVLSVLQREGPRAGLALLQEQQEPDVASNATADDLIRGLSPIVMQAVHNVLITVFDRVSVALHTLMEKMKPALQQVGNWIVKFGDKIQQGIDVFSVTLDMVQKLFDKLMAQLHGKGSNELLMLDQTFGLFDTKKDGYITAKDLQQVAALYSITALEGSVSEELVMKYDSTGDGQLSKDEMLLFVDDPAIPGAMGLILRTYGRRLAEVAGNVAAARQRDEVAHALGQYLQLVCAKNWTKVGWVSQRLTNASLPREFSATVLVQLCLMEDDPNRLTIDSIGALVVGEMYRVNATGALWAVDLLSNTTWFESEGFDLQDQPVCVERVAGWVTDAAARLQATANTTQKAASLLQANVSELPLSPSLVQLASLLGGEGQADMDTRALEAFPAMAGRLAEESVTLHLLERQMEQHRRHKELFSAKTSQLLLNRLLGGVSVRQATKGPSGVQAATRTGQMARPETLQFAKWLAYNESDNAKSKQAMCFDYSSQSSGALDSFATQIQAMVSQMQSFLDTMMKYATPAGMDQLESTVQTFAEKGMKDLIAVVELRIDALMNNSGPQLESAVHQAAHTAGEQLGQTIGKLLGSPIGSAMVPVMKSVVGQLTNNSASAENVIGNELGKELGAAVANMTAEAIAKQTGQIVEDLVDNVLSKGVGAAGGLIGEVSDAMQPMTSAMSGAKAPVALLSDFGFEGLYHSSFTSRRLVDQVEAYRGADEEQVLAALEMDMELDDQLPDVMDIISGTWNTLVNMLRSLVNTLPPAINSLKFARREVSKLSSNLDIIFKVFEEKGSGLFDHIGRFYTKLWVTYFVLLLPLDIMILYYAFWSGGYFGGPMPLSDEEEDAPVRPKSFSDRCMVCLSSCSLCFQKYHDTQMCFWSVVLLMQIVVLIIFVASILLCMLAGVKAFILAGCEQIYVLTDETVCTEALGNLRNFLDTFLQTDSLTPLTTVCSDHTLLTCQIIKDKMVTSTMLTTVFSLLSTVLSLQLILDSAVLHEQARWRRKAQELFLHEAAGREDAAERAGGGVGSAGPAGW